MKARLGPALICVCLVLSVGRNAQAEGDLGESLGLPDVQEINIVQRSASELTVRVALDRTQVELDLQPHSLRGGEFEVLVPDEQGELQPTIVPAPRTFRGHIRGMDGSRVAATIADGQLFAVILLETGEKWSVEPVASSIAGGDGAVLHAVYSGQDAASGAQCGTPPKTASIPASMKEAPPQLLVGAALRVCDIAIDADTEFYQLNGSSVAQTVFDIERVINGVALLYEAEINVTYELTTIIVRTANPDPYTSTDNGALLNEFRLEWQMNRRGVHRDIAHLMTGKNILGNVIGVAYPDVICHSCSGGFGYGLSQSRFTTTLSSRVCLTAHEIGHNWGAAHCDGASDCGLMCGNIGGCLQPCGHVDSASRAAIEASFSLSCIQTRADPLTFPFCDSFDAGLGSGAWSYNAGGEVAASAINPPSPPFALRLDNCCTECANGPDDVRSNFIPLSGLTEAVVSYYTQQAGGLSTAGSQLIVEYWSNAQTWVELNRLTSNGQAQSAFSPWADPLPPDAMHEDFRIRFSIEPVSDDDVWYVDNVAILRAVPESSILHVRQAAAAGGTGNDWNAAYDDLQEALIVSSCFGNTVHEIRVAAGAYVPDRGTGDRSATFLMPKDVAVLGGYSGLAEDSNARDPQANPTILSGEIGLPFSGLDNAYHVVTISGAGPQTILDGFTIMAGRANASTSDGGGGLKIVNSNPTIRDCLFTGNLGKNGGAVHVSSVISPNFEACTFLENTAETSGGALFLTQTSGLRLDRCSILGNSAVVNGGGLHNNGGLAELTSTILSGNTAAQGGAMNNILGTLILTNCTISGNLAASSVGGVSNTNGSSNVKSCVLWNNRGNTGATQLSQFSGLGSSINYSCVEAWNGSLGGTGNIGLDPAFVDADGQDDLAGTEDDDLRVIAGSPMINTGDPLLAPPANGLKDRAGSPRVSCARVDMGAYEFEFDRYDYNCDYAVDSNDYAAWSECIGGPDALILNPSCASLDADADGRVTLLDFADFQNTLGSNLP